MKPKQKGDMAVGFALSYFLANDYEVFLPIGDKRDFDLIVEKENKLARVQVKYAGTWGKSSRCIASLRVMGGNQSYHTAKKYGFDAFDYLFVYSKDKKSYLIPWKHLSPPRSSVVVSAPQYDKYKVLMQG